MTCHRVVGVDLQAGKRVGFVTDQGLSNFTRIACIWALAVSAALGANAQVDPEVVSIVGDPEYGAYLSQECKTCHQMGATHQGIPSILHLSANDFVVAMNAYKEKRRENQTMQLIAGRLSNEDIAALAAYFEREERQVGR